MNDAADDARGPGDDEDLDEGKAGELLNRALDRALGMQAHLVERHVERLKRSHPDASPAKLIRRLERFYLSTVTGSGLAVGGVAAAPGVGSGAALALSGGELVSNLSASTLLVLGIAHIHGMDVRDVERRRTLLLGILLGDSAEAVLRKVSERTGKHWAKKIIAGVPREGIRRVNAILGRNFVTLYGTRQGVLVLGRVVPFGIGALIGGGGNYVVGHGVIKATRLAFGAPPDHFPPVEQY